MKAATDKQILILNKTVQIIANEGNKEPIGSNKT